MFNTHDPTTGNVVSFALCGELASGPDFFVAVLAGPDASHLTPLSPTLPLNRTGAGAGFTNPFAQIYTVPGMTAGTSAVIGYEMYQGTSLADATMTLPLGLALSPVVLTEPPSIPNEVALGTHTIAIVSNCPEPATWMLGLLGLGVMTCRLRQKR